LIAVQDFEKLGAFYLGKTYDLDGGRSRDELLLYDSTAQSSSPEAWMGGPLSTGEILT
jgi:hypothetical protein